MKRLALALAAALLLAAPGSGAVKRFVPPTPDRIEAELLDLINPDRVKLGRAAAAPSFRPAGDRPQPQRQDGRRRQVEPRFSRLARRRRKTAARAIVCFLVSAENVAHSPTPFAKFIHEALMASFHAPDQYPGRAHAPGRHRRMPSRGRLLCHPGICGALSICPVPEAVMVRIENDLCRWYKEKFGHSPLVLVWMRDLLARVSAQQYLVNNPIDPAALDRPGNAGGQRLLQRPGRRSWPS